MLQPHRLSRVLPNFPTSRPGRDLRRSLRLSRRRLIASVPLPAARRLELLQFEAEQERVLWRDRRLEEAAARGRNRW